MPKHYVTFGQSHTHRVNGITLDCDTVACYTVDSPEEGRTKAFEYFGDKFFTDYHSTAFNRDTLKYFPKGIVIIDDKPTSILTWKDAYKLPLKYDGIMYAFDTANNMVLDFEDNISPDIINRIILRINNNIVSSIDGLSNEGVSFYINKSIVFTIRGWGHLVGIGGMNLGEETAAILQDDFIDYINSLLK